MKRKLNIKRKIFFLYYLIVIFFIGIGITFSRYINVVSEESKINASLFSYKVCENTQDVEIDFKGTITNEDKKLVPDAEGEFELEIDFTDMEVATGYSVLLDNEKTNIPNNLKLYTNSSKTVEFNGYNGISNIDTTKVKHKIYWKWNYTTEDETQEWMGKDIDLVLKINVEQITI